jgi:hypothetical protein
VSRRRGKSRPPPRPPTGPAALRGWTIQRATGVGVVCGIVAIIIAGLFVTRRDGLLYPYALLLAVTALCGASILWITAFDMKTRGTSGRMRPIRGFDVAVGLALLAPSAYALSLIWPELGL